jgi:hypothetical protein
MRKTMITWVVTTVALTALLAIPPEAQSQASSNTPSPASSNILWAAELESEASRLHDQRDRWSDAADLYLAAVQLREDGDPQAQQNLLLVASLSFDTGDMAGAMAALESAGSRALRSGDVVRAAGLLTDAAWVAEKAGLRFDHRALSSKIVELADSPELTRAERGQILSRLEGRPRTTADEFARIRP